MHLLLGLLVFAFVVWLAISNPAFRAALLFVGALICLFIIGQTWHNMDAVALREGAFIGAAVLSFLCVVQLSALAR